MSIPRSKFELYQEILTHVHNGNYLPTRLMHKTHISWVAFNRIKEPLISQGLLEEVEDPGDRRSRIKYRATEKGEKFLEYFGTAMKLINQERKSQSI
ncbi:hypothetical protein A3K78_06230 [Candidatus Bathyarchaeota archaeon RBG_13_52_12]|nr:MAG: hypothetical protein A3K78_06230 [Candidatus Bathyarchaeota archaeon RBG_13_52_12]